MTFKKGICIMIMPPSHSPPKWNSRSAPLSLKVRMDPSRYVPLGVQQRCLGGGVGNKRTVRVLVEIRVLVHRTPRLRESASTRGTLGWESGVRRAVRPSNGHVIHRRRWRMMMVLTRRQNKLFNILRFHENRRRTTRITNCRIARGQKA